MHSVANLATLQTRLAILFPSKKRPNLVSETCQYCASARSCAPSTHTPLSLSLSLCVCSVQRAAERSRALIQLNTDITVCCFSNLTCKYSRNHSTAIVFILCVFDFIRRRCDYHDFFVQINILEGRAGYVLMGRVSVTISYSFCCLTTETVKYTNENSFIENLASSKYSMWAKIGKQM